MDENARERRTVVSTGIHVHARRVTQVPVEDVAHLGLVALLVIRAEKRAVCGRVDEVLEEIVYQPTVSIRGA